MAAACMNTEDLQKASNIPRATLNNVISGHNVRPGTIGRVAKGLSVDVTEIIEDQKGENKQWQVVFRDYAEVDEGLLEGFTVAKVSIWNQCRGQRHDAGIRAAD